MAVLTIKVEAKRFVRVFGPDTVKRRIPIGDSSESSGAGGAAQRVTLMYGADVAAGVASWMYYVSMEHVNMTYTNPEYFAFFNATAVRPGRWDPKHYVHIHTRTLKTFDNNIRADMWFYEFRSNEYRRGFVEMHFQFCDLVLKDIFFGPALRSVLPTCPIPPGEYHMTNMLIPELPLLRTFPFRKGRIYSEVHSGARVASSFVDIEIKTMPTRLKKSNNTGR